MRRFCVFLCGFLGFVVLSSMAVPPARGDVRIGTSLDRQGVDGFVLAIGDFYDVAPPSVVYVRERVALEEVPVVFFIADRARVAPSAVVRLRASGLSWRDIGWRFGLGPEAFYVPLRVSPGPPFGRAYGYYRNRPRSQWRTIRLADADVVNLVNLRFAARRWRADADDVVRLRQSGRSFVVIHDQLGGGRMVKHHGKPPHKMKGHGKGKDH